MKVALKEIREKNILSPLLVLEILKEDKNMRFGVLKSFLLENLKNQVGHINRLNDKLKKDLDDIATYKNEIVKMKSTARNFDQKTCALCTKELSLPTVHFMCNHTYHEFCVE